MSDKCLGCATEPVTAAVNGLFDIPSFLRRDLHPEYERTRAVVSAGGPAAGVTRELKHDHAGVYGINRPRRYDTPEDVRQRALSLSQEEAKRDANKDVDKAKRSAKKAETDAANAQLHENMLAQRKVFAKDFKWGF